MGDVYTDYRTLMGRFLDGKMSAEEFQLTYLDHFKNEKRQMDESLYELLERLFGDVDLFSTDPDLLKEGSSLYLNETALREKVKQGLKRLQEI